MPTGKPAKYEPLRRYLAAQPGETVTLTFPEIEVILSAAFPVSAQEPRWWANDRGSVQSRAWRRVGWRVVETRLRSVPRAVTFERRSEES